jgi:hypothetical protein
MRSAMSRANEVSLDINGTIKALTEIKEGKDCHEFRGKMFRCFR